MVVCIEVFLFSIFCSISFLPSKRFKGSFGENILRFFRIKIKVRIIDSMVGESIIKCISITITPRTNRTSQRKVDVSDFSFSLNKKTKRRHIKIHCLSKFKNIVRIFEAEKYRNAKNILASSNFFHSYKKKSMYTVFKKQVYLVSNLLFQFSSS